MNAINCYVFTTDPGGTAYTELVEFCCSVASKMILVVRDPAKDHGAPIRQTLERLKEFRVETQRVRELYVRPRDEAGASKWCVQISLVGDYAVVSEMVSTGRAPKAWPITEARTAHPGEATLLRTLCSAGLELLPYAVLQEPTPFRPPNADADEVYTIYNALFTDAVPYPLPEGIRVSNAETK